MNLSYLPTLIISLSFFAESIFGFGGGLISIPLLSLASNVKEAVTLVLIFQLLMGLLILKTYRYTNWLVARSMTVGLIIGTILGTYSLAIGSEIFLRKFLAISILLFLIKMIFFKDFRFGKHAEKKWGLVAGLIGGWFQGLIGTGGPVLTMYLAVAVPQKQPFRATLIYLFFATSVVRMLTSISTGLITPGVMGIALPVLPFFLVAIFLGQLVHERIDEKYYRYAVYTILLFAAISMLLK